MCVCVWVCISHCVCLCVMWSYQVKWCVVILSIMIWWCHIMWYDIICFVFSYLKYLYLLFIFSFSFYFLFLPYLILSYLTLSFFFFFFFFLFLRWRMVVWRCLLSLLTLPRNIYPACQSFSKPLSSSEIPSTRFSCIKPPFANILLVVLLMFNNLLFSCFLWTWLSSSSFFECIFFRLSSI